MKRQIILLIGFVQAMSFTGYGQISATNISFDIVNEKKGLSHHAVTCIFQDSKGFVWAGTEYGLNRYDGVACIRYFAQNGGKNKLANDRINSVAEDVNGNIWVGTGEGISQIDLRTGLIKNYLTTNEDKAALGNLSFHVFSDKLGQIWAGNPNFLLRYYPQTGQFRKYGVDCGQSLQNTRNYFILDLLHDSKGRYWLATSYGVKQFDTATGIVKSYHFKEAGTRLTANAIACLAESPDGKILAGTWGSGMLVFEETHEEFKPYLMPKPREAINMANIILDIAFDGSKIYLATVKGLLVHHYPFNGQYLEKGEGFQQFLPKDEDSRSLPGDVVNKLLIDRTGDLWVATNNNIGRADFRLTNFQHRRIFDYNNEPLIPAAIFQSPADTGSGNYLIGAYNLFKANFKNAGVALLDIAPHLKHADGPSAIWDISNGRKGIWVAGTGGLLRLNAQTKRVEQKFTADGTKGFSLAGNRLWKVYEDKSGLVWIATIRRGLSLLNQEDGAIQNFFTAPNEKGSLHNKYISNFFEDRAGNIWFGSDDYLYKYDKKTGTFILTPFSVYEAGAHLEISGKPGPFFEDHQGNIWLTIKNGIVSFDPAEKAFKPLILNQSFFRPEGDVLVLPNGNFWFGTSNGLFRLDTVGMQLTRFTTSDGLVSNETDRCMQLLTDGSILIGSYGHLTRFFPEALAQKESIAPVVISKIQVNGKDTGLIFEQPPLLKHQSTLMFEFAALSFANAEQNQYQYMLAGADKEWNKPSENRTVTYAMLPPGKYTFQVNGSNSDGVWNAEPATFSFTILTPFYLRAWFIGLVVLVIGSLLMAFYKYRLGQALRVERMRTRLATDLHDDVGATLSAISMYSEALKRQVDQPQLANLLGKIGEESRETVVAMSDLVWAINPKNDKGDKLLQRIENYATDLCAAKEVALVIEKNIDLSEYSLDIETRRNIFLIFKEALNNALKYATCSKVIIELGVMGNNLHLTIEDNGCGFDVDNIMPGNGLINMGVRAKEIKGQLTVAAKPGLGCIVKLQCPV